MLNWKYLINNGIIFGIYKDNKSKDIIDLSAIQFLFSGLINKKKYKLKFSSKEEPIICIINDLQYRKKIINERKEIISNKLNKNKNLIILTNPSSENEKLYLDLAFNPEIKINNYNYIKNQLLQGDIIDCEIIPLLEECRLSSSIFDHN